MLIAVGHRARIPRFDRAEDPLPALGRAGADSRAVGWAAAADRVREGLGAQEVEGLVEVAPVVAVVVLAAAVADLVAEAEVAPVVAVEVVVLVGEAVVGQGEAGVQESLGREGRIFLSNGSRKTLGYLSCMILIPT